MELITPPEVSQFRTSDDIMLGNSVGYESLCSYVAHLSSSNVIGGK